MSAGGGESTSAGSAASQRRATTLSSRSTVLPTFLSDLIANSSANADIPSSWKSGSENFISGLLTRDNTIPQGNSYLTSALSGLDNPSSLIPGYASLTNQAQIDPTTSSYETDTAANYEDRVRQGISQLNTGPDTVRGGTARAALSTGEALNRMALERSDEIRRQRDADSKMSQNANQLLMSLEQGRRAALMSGQNQLMQQYLAGMGQSFDATKAVNERAGSITQLWEMAAKLLGANVASTSEETDGFGAQTTASQNFSLNI